jgi:hypothetical protein
MECQMGVTASYRRVTPTEWEKFESLFNGINARRVRSRLQGAYLEFAYSEELTSSGRYLDLEKEWHTLHALLTGDFSGPSEIKPFPPPLGNVVMGGTETPIDATYGKVRFLTTSEVREVADALSRITVDDLRSRFDPVAFTEADIYGWDDDIELEILLDYYPRLVAFFGAAAREGDVVLLSLD